MSKTDIFNGCVVQLSPDCKNPMLAACFMTVTEVRTWGAIGFVQALGSDGKMGGQAFYRATWEEFELVGEAVWVPKPGPVA